MNNNHAEANTMPTDQPDLPDTNLGSISESPFTSCQLPARRLRLKRNSEERLLDIQDIYIKISEYYIEVDGFEFDLQVRTTITIATNLGGVKVCLNQPLYSWDKSAQAIAEGWDFTVRVEYADGTIREERKQLAKPPIIASMGQDLEDLEVLFDPNLDSELNLYHILSEVFCSERPEVTRLPVNTGDLRRS